jgi:hypothetical protein
MQKLVEMLRKGEGFKPDYDLAAKLEQKMHEAKSRGARPV